MVSKLTAKLLTKEFLIHVVLRYITCASPYAVALIGVIMPKFSYISISFVSNFLSS